MWRTGSPRRPARGRFAALLTLCAIASAPPSHVHAWGAQGHRLVGAIAADLLTPAARREVDSLLDGRTLADVGNWADQIRDDLQQTANWHYVNIPIGAAGYDRDRDCPRQTQTSAGSRADRWRDCIVDRIDYARARLASRSLDRADRATALKFLVHLVGDIHQPFHAIGVARGGNGIPVKVFGSSSCGVEGASSQPCNLHYAWDVSLMAHRGLDDGRYAAGLSRRVAAARTTALRAPADWAMESQTLAAAALLPARGDVDDAYYRTQIEVVDDQIARAGVRLAGLINEALSAGGRPASRRRQGAGRR